VGGGYVRINLVFGSFRVLSLGLGGHIVLS
jgi:hypothetical protein